MFVVDYNHQLFDHRKVLILVKNIDPICETCVFEDVYASLCNFHGILFPKLLSPGAFFGRSSRLPPDALIDTQSEFGFSNQADEQPVWVRFTRQFHSSNNAWSSFQSHRLVLGVVGLSLCKTTDDILNAIQNYMKQKALISENYSSGRLILLIPSSGDSPQLTIEEANELISLETKKLPQGLLLVAGEILAHPAEQILNTDFINLNDLSPDSAIGTQKQPGSLASHPPILNTRVVGALTDLVSQIYYGLEKSVASVDAISKQLSKPSTASAATEASDGDGSESNYKVLIAPGESSYSRLSDDSSAVDEQKLASKSFVNYTPVDPTSGPSSQSDASFNFLNVVKHRRSSGRWKKHLGDVFLQLGDLDKAQNYYDATIQLLRPIMDNLWVAGALEGLCAVAVARKIQRTSFSDLSSHSRRPLRPSALRYPASERSQPRVTDASGLDLASQKQKPTIQINPAEYRNLALEALELYRKSQVDKYMLEETSYEIARFLISENHKAKACELLDFLFTSALHDDSDENTLKPKRMRVLIELYRAMGYTRRAAFVAWIALDENLKSVNEAEFCSLFGGLRVQVFPSVTPAEVDNSDLGPSNSPASPSVALPPATSGCSLSVLRRPAFPTSVHPVLIRQSVVWFRGLSNMARFSRMAKCAMAVSSNRSGGPQFNQSKRFEHGTGAIENARFLPAGWAALQATVLWRIIEQFKSDVQFDDVLELPWEKALKFTGFIFSLLDAWPDQLDESKCVTCMEDLCRLAVMRCPDQPSVATSMPCFTVYASGNADRHHWSRQFAVNGDQTNKQRPILIERENTVQFSRPVQPRQLVDLVEVPVYRLPLVQSLQLLPLAPYLVPCELSKEGLNSAVPFGQSLDSYQSEISVKTLTTLSESKTSTGPFFYNPIAHDSAGDSEKASIDWVCEEPVNIELILDNQLPVDLRISEVRLELTPLFTGSTKAHSSVRSSFEYGSIMSVDNQTSVQLDAVRMVMELPPDCRARTSSDRFSRQKSISQSSNSLKATFSVVMNEACLLETAEDCIRHPRATLQSASRRRNQSLSCSLPAGRTGVRLVVSFIPMVEMLTADPGLDDPNSKPLYRVSALTYRLVDFGGMHVCLRPTTNSPNSTCPVVIQEYPLSNRERRLSNSSSSAASGISLLRSSLTSGIESLIPPQTPNNGSSFDHAPEHHPALILATRLFNNLPAVLVRPPMPRLCLFPGVVRTAATVEEAADFLPELTVPSLGKQSKKLASQQGQSIQPPLFRAPLSSQWSQRVAAVVDLSLYPYETRWMPMQLFVRDEGYLPPVACHDESNTSSARYLNALCFDFRPTKNTKDLLEKLKLTTADVVECVGMDAIRRKLPLRIANEEHEETGRSRSPDSAEENLLPIRATECGLIWLGFRSEHFWQRLSLLLTRPTANEDLGEGLNLRNSKKLSIEFEIEYALNAPAGQAAKSVSLSNPFWARCVRLGIQLNLLSSKHAPLLIYHPQIMFRDEPFGDDDSEVEDVDGHAGNGDGSLTDVNSKSFFYCTFRARLPQSLVPRPIRYIGPQYRTELELRARWRDESHRSRQQPHHLCTPWTVLSENRNRRLLDSAPSSAFSRSESVLSCSSVATDSFNTIEQSDDQSKDETRLYQCVALPLNSLSDVALTVEPVQLSDPDRLRADEIGLPIPTNTAWLLHAIESNIEITWQSRLFGRAPPSEARGLLGSDWSSRMEQVAPDPRFYRFGRLILSAHFPELTLPEKQGPPPEPTSPRAPVLGPTAPLQPWYGNSFSTPGQIAGLLWCHNIRLEVSLSEFHSAKHSAANMLTVDIKQFPQGRLCVRCRDEGRRSQPHKSIFGRRISQPLPYLPNGTISPVSSSAKVARMKAVSEDTDSDGHVSHPSRRASVPELRSPQYLRSLDSDLLQSTLRMCTLPLEPISILIKGWVHYHPLHGVRIHNPAQTDPEYLPDYSPPSIAIHRIWTGPVVYEILTKRSPDTPTHETQTTELKGPLLQGKEFEFIGKAGGEIGLSLSSQMKEMSLESHTSSIVFFRPGRFWICGLMGIVPQSVQLPSVDSADLAVFTLPSVSNVETIRFSPKGIIVHVLDSSRVLDDSS